MPDDRRADGEKIARLLDEVRAMAGPTTWARVQELVECIVRLYGEGLARTLEIAGGSRPIDPAVAERLTADELVSSLLLLHGLHPVGMDDRVRRAVEELAPRLAGDATVSLAGIGRDGVVRIRMDAGEDRRCGFSAAALARTVEQAVLEAAPDAARVEILGLAPPSPPERLVAIGRRASDTKVQP